MFMLGRRSSGCRALAPGDNRFGVGVTSEDALAGADLGALWHRPGEGQRTLALSMTVRDRVVLELRHRILLGELKAGDRIDLDALATEFGSSRTPIREACLLLANDNLVESAPRSGINHRNHQRRPAGQLRGDGVAGRNGSRVGCRASR